jgi:rod shape-determining protein MreB
MILSVKKIATSKETGVAAYVAEAPMACVAMGAGKALENYATIRRSIGGL